MAAAQLCGCLGREAHRHTVSSAWWLVVLQLQGVPFRNPHGLGRTPTTSSFGQKWAAMDQPVMLKCSNNSELKEPIDKGVLGLPAPEPLPNDDKPMPFYIAADDAFALKNWLMKPFSKKNMSHSERVYNYRLSRGRRIVENAFGILAHRFRCPLTTMLQSPETVTSIVLSCICLHNLLRLRNRNEHVSVADQEDNNHNIIPG